MASFWPSKRLKSVDFPAFGKPKSATTPQRYTGLASPRAFSGKPALGAAQRGDRGFPLCLAFGASHARSERALPHTNLHHEASLVVFDTAVGHVVVGGDAAEMCLGPLLELCFGIALRWGSARGEGRPEARPHQRTHGVRAGIQIERTHDRLEKVGEDGVLLRASGPL